MEEEEIFKYLGNRQIKLLYYTSIKLKYQFNMMLNHNCIKNLTKAISY